MKFFTCYLLYLVVSCCCLTKCHLEAWHFEKPQASDSSRTRRWQSPWNLAPWDLKWMLRPVWSSRLESGWTMSTTPVWDHVSVWSHWRSGCVDVVCAYRRFFCDVIWYDHDILMSVLNSSKHIFRKLIASVQGSLMQSNLVRLTKLGGSSNQSGFMTYHHTTCISGRGWQKAFES